MMSDCEKCGSYLHATDRFCSHCGNPVAATAPPNVTEPERRLITVLFCDLVGSTALSAELDAEEFREIIRMYQGVCVPVIQNHGGHIAQFLGDGILVYFGYPQIYEDSARRALRAGLGIQRGIASLAKELESTWGINLSVRIGIHSGTVVVDDIGDAHKAERIALGETPNVAAKLQSLANPGQAIVSGVTKELAGDRFSFTDLGQQDVKGVRDAIHLYRLTGTKKSYIPSHDGQAIQLLGRDADLKILNDIWQQRRQLPPPVVHVNGVAGIGKTHLVEAFLASAEASVAKLECSAQHSATPFWPVTQWVRELLNADSEFKTSDIISNFISTAELSDEHAVGLHILMNVDHCDTPTDPSTKRTMTIATAKKILGEYAIVLCEDTHWADASTLDLLPTLAASNTVEGSMIIVTSRDADLISSDKGNVKSIELDALDQNAAESLVKSLQSDHLAAKDIDDIVQRSGGLPLFLYELAKNQSIEDSESTNRALPPTLQSLLLTQLDRTGEAKRVAQEAAVFGGEFTHHDIASVSTVSSANLTASFTTLEEAGLLEHISSGEVESTYKFRHAVTQEVAYDSLLRRTRAQIHRRIANHFEKASNGEADGAIISKIAYHWKMSLPNRGAASADIRQTVDYQLQSAEYALSLSAFSEARTLANDVLALIDKMPNDTDACRLRLRYHLISSVCNKALEGFASPSVEADYRAARDLAIELDQKRELALVLLGLWSLQLGRAEYLESLESASACLDQASELNDPVIEYRALTAMSNSEFWLGRLEQALEHANVVINSYSSATDPMGLIEHGWDAGIQAHLVAVWSHWLLGLPHASAIEENMNALTATMEHPINRALCANTSAVFQILRRDGERTIAAADDLILVAEKFGLGFYKVFGDMFKAAGLMYLGRLDEGFEAADGVYQFYENNMGGLAETFMAAVMVTVYAGNGDHSRALMVAKNGIKAAERSGEQVFAKVLQRQHTVLESTKQPEAEQLSICGNLSDDGKSLSSVDERNFWTLAATANTDIDELTMHARQSPATTD